MTSIPIANYSYEYYFHSDSAFITAGILLNIRNGHYYFSPMLIAPNDGSTYIEPRLVVLPADEVLFFDQ